MEPEPQLFYLQRDQDLSGLSGTGRVADGVLWPDGSCCVRWRSETSSVSVWSSFSDMVKIHGHNGATRILFPGEPDLHRQLREGAAEAERGETKYLGSFSEHLAHDEPRADSGSDEGA